jgi:hypothetical protein
MTYLQPCSPTEGARLIVLLADPDACRVWVRGGQRTADEPAHGAPETTRG